MALDTFSIQLKLELERFLNNVTEARLKIKSLEKAAEDTGKKISRSFGEIETPVDEIEETEGAVSKLGSVLVKVGKAITVAGGIVAGLAALRFVLNDVAEGGGRIAASFARLGTGVSTLAGSITGAIRVFGVAGNSIAFLTGKLASLSGSVAGVQTGLISLARDPAVQNFARNLVTAFDAITSSIARAVTSIPRLATSLKDIVIGGRRVSQVLAAIPAVVGNLSAALGNFVSSGVASSAVLTRLVPDLGGIIRPVRNAVFALAGFSGILTGIASKTFGNFIAGAGRLLTSIDAIALGSVAGIPVLGRFFLGLKKTALGATLFSVAAGDAGAASAVLTTAVGGLNIAVIALNAAIGIAGVILTKLGKALLGVAERFGLLAARTELAGKKIEFALERANKATEEGIGNFKEINKFIDQTAEKLGASIKSVTEITAAFTLLQPQMQLSSELFRQVIEDTVVLAVSTGQAGRALIDVGDVFKNLPGPLRNFVGIATGVTDIEERLAEDEEFRALVLSKVTEETEKNILATARAITVTEGVAASTKLVTDGSNNLIIANSRLTASFENLGVELGTSVSPILSRIVDLLGIVTDALKAIPAPIKALIGQFVTLAGAVAVILGTFLKFASLLILVSNGARIFTGILGLSVGKLGTVRAILEKTTSSLTGTNVAITGLGSVLKAFVLVAAIAFKRAATAITSFVAGILTLEIGFGKLVTSGGGFLVVLRKIFSRTGALVAKNVLLLGGLLPLIVAFEGATRLFKRLNEQYKFGEGLASAINSIFGTQFNVVESLVFVFAKLSQILEVGVLLIMAGLQGIAFGLVQAFLLLLDAVGLLNKVFDFLTFNLFETEKGFKELTKGLREVTEAVRDDLSRNIEKTSENLVTMIKRVASTKEGLKDAEQEIKKTGNSAKKITVTIKQLAAGFDVLKTSLDAVFAQSEADFQRQIDLVRKLTEAQIEGAELTTASEDDKAKEVIRIQRRSTSIVIALSKKRLDESIKAINLREQVEIEALDREIKTEKRSFEERLKNIAEVTTAANEARAERLREFIAVTDEELDRERKLARAREKIVRDSEKNIENLQKARVRRIEDLQIGLLTPAAQVAKKQERFEKEIGEATEKRRRGDLAGAQEALNQADKDGQELVGRAAKTAEAQTLANRGAAERDRRIAGQRLNDIRGIFFGRIPSIAKKSFDEVSRALFTGLDPTAAFQALEQDLAKVAAKQAVAAQIAAAERIKTEQDAISKARERRAEADKIAQAQVIKDLERQNAEAAERLDKIKQKLAEPFKIVAEFFAKPEDVSRIEAIKKQLEQAITIPVNFASRMNVDGASMHRIRDAAGALREVLTPEPIIADVSSRTGDVTRIGSSRRSGDSSGNGIIPSRIVRVDINMDGQETPINVASDADAERLTTFAERLKNIGRTKGNFRSPFVRNS